MKNYFFKVISVLLTTCMICSTLTVGASAVTTENTNKTTQVGTEQNADEENIINKYLATKSTSLQKDNGTYTIIETGSCGENLTYELRSDGTLFISGSGGLYSFDNFSNNEKIKNVIIEYGLTGIGNKIFQQCENLINIYIPDSVTYIGEKAFYNCTSLTSITIPNNVTYIDEETFYNCTSLTSIKIPNSVTRIASGAFYNCTSLTSITIPDSVFYIGGEIFYNCTSLTSITIPDSVISIGGRAFYNCTSLTNIAVDDNNNNYASLDGNLYDKDKSTLITYAMGKEYTFFKIPYSVTSIDEGAFYGCTYLINITIPNNVTSIDNGAFKGCTSLTSITVDDDNKNYSSLDGNLYNKDKSTLITCAIGKKYTSFKIPESVTSIGKKAFYGCTFLKNITIPNSVTYIDYDAFYYCTALISITIPDSVTYIDYCAFGECTSLTSITIPESVTYIGGEAFYNCTSLTNITIPKSVTSIGTGVFFDCNSLINIIVNDDNENYSSLDGNLYNKDKSTLIAYAIGKKNTSFKIPESVTSIYYGAFNDCAYLTNIIIPNSITSIGGGTFYGCKALTDVFYTGTEEDWKKIDVDKANTSLNQATIHYNYNANQNLGDVDGNGILTISDVTTIQMYIAEMVKFDKNQLKLADYTGDGIIDICDVTDIQIALASSVD